MTTCTTAQAAHLSDHHARQVPSVGLAASRRRGPTVQGCPDGAPHGAALTAARLPAAGAGQPANGRTAAMCFAALATCALLAALPPPASAQALDLEHGLYVVQGEPCSGATSTAMLNFDGRQFDNKGVQCTLEMASRAGDTYAVTCMEGSDTRTRETQRWTYKRIDRRSFSINGSAFRFCPVQP